jgi:transposase-like protein
MSGRISAMTHPGGRPSLLTADFADRLVAELAGGATLGGAAAVVGVNPRTLRAWRQRAWSRRPDDLPYVQLERRVQQALRRARGTTSEPHHAEPWQAAPARLAASNPAEWGQLTDLVDVGVDVDVDDWFKDTTKKGTDGGPTNTLGNH